MNKAERTVRRAANPILAGFYPDPSICRQGVDYYLTTSSFEYFPGCPLFHSRDLVNWRQIGHILDRPSQLDLAGVGPSQGIFAPTLREHQGVFYLVTTLVGGANRSGHFIVTTDTINSSWSEPIWLEEAPGIDPSLFFDDDGRIWFTANRKPPCGERYPGHREIWLQEFDLRSKRLTGDRYALWDGAAKTATWAEAPHIFNKDGYYYLIIAEGGTGFDHAVTVARSRSITGPYEANSRNPILTHRHLGDRMPVIATGHADLVQTQNSDWWMVVLAMRRPEKDYAPLGRETFLIPVDWQDGWPVAHPGIGRVSISVPAPALPPQPWPKDPGRIRFDTSGLGPEWVFLRFRPSHAISTQERQGFLRMQLKYGTLSQPLMVSRRLQHLNFTAAARFEFAPDANGDFAGIALWLHPRAQIRFILTGPVHNPELCLLRIDSESETVLATAKATEKHQSFFIEAKGRFLSFYYRPDKKEKKCFCHNVDAMLLSPLHSGGFTGTMIGLIAGSENAATANHVDFAWFDYHFSYETE